MTTPPGACDRHVYDPDQGPAPDGAGRIFPAATLAAHRRVQVRLGLQRAVVVQPNAYGTDNRSTLAAVAALEPDARGVAIVTPATPDSELARLHAAAIRGARRHVLCGTVSGEPLGSTSGEPLGSTTHDCKRNACQMGKRHCTARSAHLT